MHLVVSWPRLGPYHLARLRATHALFAERGGSVTALETARTDRYAWREERGREPFERLTLFENAPFESLDPADVHRRVTAALDRLRPDAVAITSYSYPDARACLAWCRRHRKPAVLMSASRAEDGERAGWREWIKRQIVQAYDTALVGGAPQQRYVQALGIPESRTFFPANAVDNAFYAAGAEAARADKPEAARQVGLDEAGPFFLAVGRLLAIKNVDGLLHAYAAYREAAADPWPLVIVGDGPEREALERLGARLGLAEAVTFAGFQQRDTLPIYYGLAGAFVHPSHKDTWGLVVNEAMATGLPVVVSRQSGCAEDLVLDGETGFSFDSTDLEALAARLVRIASPECDRAALGARARHLIEDWSPERFADGMWKAAHAGLATADRPMPPIAAALLRTLRFVARTPRAFHSIPE